MKRLSEVAMSYLNPLFLSSTEETPPLDTRSESEPLEVPMQVIPLSGHFNDISSYGVSETSYDSFYFLRGDHSLYRFNSKLAARSSLQPAEQHRLPPTQVMSAASSCILTGGARLKILWANKQYLILGMTYKENASSPLIKRINLLEVQQQEVKTLKYLDIDYDHIDKVAVSPGLQFVVFSHGRDIKVRHLNTSSLITQIHLGDKKFPVSTLKILSDNRLISVSLDLRNIICWRVESDKLVQLWEFKQNTTLTLLHDYALTFHSDCVICRNDDRKSIDRISLKTGEILDNTLLNEREIVSIKKINDDRIVICGASFMALYNIRTKACEWKSNPKECLAHYQPSELVVMSPSCILTSDKLVANLWDIANRRTPYPITHYRFRQPNDKLYLKQLVPLIGGYTFFSQKNGEAFLKRPLGFIDPIEDIIERRTSAAICLAVLTHGDGSLVLDVVANILSFIRSGYESAHALSQINDASMRLAHVAKEVVEAKFKSIKM